LLDNRPPRFRSTKSRRRKKERKRTASLIDDLSTVRALLCGDGLESHAKPALWISLHLGHVLAPQPSRHRNPPMHLRCRQPSPSAKSAKLIADRNEPTQPQVEPGFPEFLVRQQELRLGHRQRTCLSSPFPAQLSLAGAALVALRFCRCLSRSGWLRLLSLSFGDVLVSSVRSPSHAQPSRNKTISKQLCNYIPTIIETLYAGRKPTLRMSRLWSSSSNSSLETCR